MAVHTRHRILAIEVENNHVIGRKDVPYLPGSILQRPPGQERDDDDQRLGGLQVPPVVVHRGLGVELRQHDLM